MSDLISRQAAIEYLMTNMNWYDEDGHESDDDYKRECITELINGVPSAQRTGRWKVSDLPKGKMKYCSECGFGQYIADERRYGFCPSCGAQMDEEDNK